MPCSTHMRSAQMTQVYAAGAIDLLARLEQDLEAG